jgi:very-short-patch-repair endonuclease
MVYKKRVIEPEMFFGAKPEIFEKAKELRRNMTEAEKMLWSALRRNQFHGYYFRRQHPIDQFIADFYCHEARLVIEVDGAAHDLEDQKEYDEGRSYEMQKWNITVIRFTNERIHENIQNVLSEIQKHLATKRSLPFRGGKEG